MSDVQRWRSAALGLILLALLPARLVAFSLEPISASFSPSGRGAIRSFTLKNETSEMVAIRISLFHRSGDIDGREIQSPAEERFTVYPSQLVLRPDSIQMVRVQWKGAPRVEKELAFRMLVEQMPVNFSEQEGTGSGVKIMFKYLASLYITPPGAAAQVNVDDFSLQNKDEVAHLELFVSNRGTAHTIITNPRLELLFQEADDPVVVDIGKYLGGQNLLAGAERRLLIPLKDEQTDGSGQLPGQLPGQLKEVRLLHEEE